MKVSFESAGFELVGELDLPPCVILFHGLTNARRDCPLINETAKELRNAGFAVLRFDFYGSGESPGQMKDKKMNVLYQNALDAIDFVKDRGFKKIGLWGRSLGGTLVCLIPPNEKIRARVSASGGVFFEKTMREKFTELQRKEAELERVGKKLPGTGNYKGPFRFESAWFESLRGLDLRIEENLKQLDTILVLGTSLDQKITLDNACKIMKTVNEPKKLRVFEADHDYAGCEEEAVSEAVKWFKNYLMK